jgi:hypothetical protein
LDINDFRALRNHEISLAKRIRFASGRKRKDSFRFSLRAKSWEAGCRELARAKNLEKREKAFFARNPLITTKTAKGIFGKAWRKQALYLEKFGKKLGKICTPRASAVPCKTIR